MPKSLSCLLSPGMKKAVLSQCSRTNACATFTCGASRTQELGNTDEFDTSVLEQRLAKSEIIDYDWPAQRPQFMEAPKAVRKGGAGFQKTESDEDSDLD